MGILGLGLAAVVGICLLAFMILGPGGGGPALPVGDLGEVLESQGAGQGAGDLGQLLESQGAQPGGQLAPVAPAQPAVSEQFAAVTPDPSRAGETWTVMLYQNADDRILEQDIFVDMNEAELVGSSDQVKIVSQLDRYRGGFSGDGNWTETRRYLVTRDDDLNAIRSQPLASGEADMALGDSLVDFATWAIKTYPADKYALILSDHGMGWPGGWSDPDPAVRAERDTPLSAALGNQLYLNELDAALGEIRAQAGIDKLELVGMDACLMAHIEVFEALQPHARYAVASQETEPALGWAYASFLGDLQRNPGMDGAELGQAIVASYIEDDQRIVNPRARAEFAGRSGASAEALAAQLQHSVTLTALDLEAMPEVMASLNNLAYTLSQLNQRDAAEARTYAQSFTNIFGKSTPSPYIDLAHFAALVQEATRNNPEVTAAVERLYGSLRNALVAEKHGYKKPGATGISIYFPNSTLYGQSVSGPQSYVPTAQRFAENSLWDDFLAFHYTGRPFQPSAADLAVPEAGARVTAPGAGAIQLSPVEKSGEVASANNPVLVSTDIDGENIGYVYFFTGFYDQEANSLYVADTDYLDSADTREISGVYYPDWGEGPFTMEFEWEPLMFAINDGTNRVQVALQPETYGQTAEEAEYTVDGIYTYANGGEQRKARLTFRNGVLRSVFGFTEEAEAGDQAVGAPREILPTPGDTFTVFETWLDLDQSGRVVDEVSEEGGTLTFGQEPFTWQELDAAPGQYVIGFIVEDLDGNKAQVYTDITVQ
jgi:hypothetical protein